MGVDLFAGAGGLALGFEQAGFDVVAAVEYDPVHAATHAFNFPLAEVLCADVARLSGRELQKAVQAGRRRHGLDDADEVDVVFGGPPCQGFSTIGKRLVEDTRNRLVFHFFRLIEELRPRYFCMENVPGMTVGGHSGILGRLIEEFENAGYHVPSPRILKAAEYVVPQDRRRLFLIGSRAGEPVAGYPAPTSWPASKPDEQGASVAIGPTVGEAIGDLPDQDAFSELAGSDAVLLSPSELRRGDEMASTYARRLRGIEGDPDDRSHPRRWNRALLTSSARTSHTPLSVSRFQATKPGDTERVSRFLRLDPAGLCNTLRAGSGSERGAFTSPRPIHPLLPRVISVREAARLHSFPDWFRLHATKWHGFRQIGNAVPPLLGRAVAAEIVAAQELAPGVPTEPLDLGDVGLLTLTMSRAAERLGADPDALPAQRIRDASRLAAVF